jgi:hypothetical protein
METLGAFCALGTEFIYIVVCVTIDGVWIGE